MNQNTVNFYFAEFYLLNCICRGVSNGLANNIDPLPPVFYEDNVYRIQRKKNSWYSDPSPSGISAQLINHIFFILVGFVSLVRLLPYS